jgi:hypothetical protein
MEWAGMVLCLSSVAWALQSDTPLPAESMVEA